MTWVKRGGGAGRGAYGQGLPPADAGQADEGEPRARPAVREARRGMDYFGFRDASDEPGLAPAYRVSTEQEVRDHRIILDLVARIVAVDGQGPEASMYYGAALAAFGSRSPHFIAACQGQTGAGEHYLNGYLNAVAAGRIRQGG